MSVVHGNNLVEHMGNASRKVGRGVPTRDWPVASPLHRVEREDIPTVSSA